ncbi:uncharacterized protein B0T15DRAFT_386282 [Chaetomium strumarium]|uniref:C2H2-type domain-containing protein n=1 Tax=Chaetomium strumarium TaxID=1170767 RepID=A0AAJ0H3B0_9PEZI|nr:hypothetical protein B0T15DRAFT_386282 [Chaetomium strumarium]
METDFDFDALWSGDLDHSTTPIEPDLNLDYYPSVPSAFGLPADFLFAEDEGVFPATISYNARPSYAPDTALGSFPAESSPTRTIFPVTRSDTTPDDARHMEEEDAHGHDVAHQRLRRQLSLLSKGWAGDEIRFKNCDPAKAIVLHSLAMELGLGYSHDVRSREVSMSRLGPAQPPSRPQLAPGCLSSSLPRSSTELDSTLCLPGLPAVPMCQLPEVATHVTQDPSPVPTKTASPSEPDAAPNDQSLTRRPSRSERIISTLKTSISKGGRRGPLSENGRRAMKALEGAGGACWRCKVLRRKCDPDSPCRCCLQSVPTPHLGEDAPLWPLIGCRRGPLRDSIPAQLLCPRSNRHPCLAGGERPAASRRCHSVDAADRCLLAAEDQRLADMKAVLEGASYKLSITDPPLNSSFSLFIETGRYRDRECLKRSYSYEGKSVTYTELIAMIAWELAENSALLPLLEIRSWDGFMNMLETACVYESEVGQTSLVILSIVCLRHSLEALRLHSANLLEPEAHESCGGGQCRVECIRNLSSRVATYIDELSSVVFNKENMRDRRWWLSTFYSLYIQSYVRHALIAIEKQLRFQSADDVPAEDLTATQYLHLPAVLFTAASAKYDPLLGDGRLHYALTDHSVIPETSVPELHHACARVACEVNKWAEVGIRTPYQFLRRLLQIGSLDFFDSGHHVLEMSKSGSPVALDAPPSGRGMVLSPSSPGYGAGDERQAFLKPFPQGKRDSVDSRYSGQPSTMFSNQSSDSLARTMSTDMTSLYESSLLTRASFSDSAANLETEMCLDIGTLSPSAIFSGRHNRSSQSFDPPVPETAKIPAKSEVADMGLKSIFFCNCCPRAPRQFQTSEGLARHEAEKPHPCTQCKKRFKSPTEAERHMNAIHVKSDFWSCKALEDSLLAYDTETVDGAAWDVCGFCGFGFLRENGAVDREKLVNHVEVTHRIGECDRSKNFYRADNFRQHLKNTHAATPGRWLKGLEHVCRSTRDSVMT